MSYVSRPVGVAGQLMATARPPCKSLLVFFSERATVGDVSALVGPLVVTVVSGPSPAGAFELAVPEARADAVAALLGRAEDVVEGVFVKPKCGLP